MNKEEFMNKINILAEAGKKKGYITYDEINSMFSDVIDIELIDRVFDELYRRGIKIEDEFSYSTKKNYKKMAEDNVNGFIDTPEKFYFFELRKDYQWKTEEDKILYYSKKITDVKIKIKDMLMKTNYFVVRILKDMYKIKQKYITMDTIFSGSDNLKKKDIENLYREIKSIYKSKITQGYKDGRKNVVIWDDIYKLLKGIDIKFQYCIDILKELIDKNKEVTELENRREMIKKEYNLNDTQFDEILDDIIREYPVPIKAIAPAELSIKTYIRKYKQIDRWFHTFRVDKEELKKLSQNGARMINLYNEIKKILINMSIPIVIKIANMYKYKQVLFQDLIQEGNVALLEAIDRYDFYRCNKNFISYVRWWIRDKISKIIAHNNAPIKLSRQLKKEVELFLKRIAVMRNRLARYPTQEEIATELNWSVEKVIEITKYIKKTVSLNDVQNDGKSLLDYISDEKSLTPLEIAMNNILKEKLKNIILNLPYIEQKVIEMRFGINEYENTPLYYDEIAVLLKMSVDEVKRVEQRALNKLRYYGKEKGLDQFLE